jgi:hypothetical protein
MSESLRPEVLPLPARVQQLPIARGYPVPWFVEWVDGVPDFRVMNRARWRRAIEERRCWICGGPLGVHLAFVLGPMCGINRTTTEPPCHAACAEWAARACPFLSRPHAHRRDLPPEQVNANQPGLPLLRNPGVTLIWYTRVYSLFPDGHGNQLIEIGPADRVKWYAEGRPATREEVQHSIETGYPALLEVATQQDAAEPGAGAVAELSRRALAFIALYPRPGLEA